MKHHSLYSSSLVTHHYNQNVNRNDPESMQSLSIDTKLLLSGHMERAFGCEGHVFQQTHSAKHLPTKVKALHHSSDNTSVSKK